MEEFINLTLDNIEDEHLCCIIRSKVKHPGVESKRNWLKERLQEGHVFRKLNQKATVFLEYAPLEVSWVPIVGDNYYYIYCLWVLGAYKGKGYGKSLLEYAIRDAKTHGKSGLCMLGNEKQKAWLSDQSFFLKYGFKVVDKTTNGYYLFALSFDGTYPSFASNAKKEIIDAQELVIYYDMQCPFIYEKIDKIKEYCEQENIAANFVLIDTLEKAKALPRPFNNWAVFYKGQFQTVNLLDVSQIARLILKK